MKIVKFGILGCGKIGNRHAEKMQKVRGAKLAAVCDVIPERADYLAKKYKCKAFYGIKDILKEESLDILNICTPSGLHPEHSIIALNAGKNVLSEKPMALREKDARKMIAAARKNKKMLFVVKQNRYNPPVLLVTDLLKKKKLKEPIQCIVNVLWNRGDNYYKSDAWRGTKKLDGGALFTQASHFVDLMLMFMGKPKKLFSLAGTKNHKIETEDTGNIAVEFENGAFGTFNYTTCAAKKNAEGSITLIFKNGTIKIGGEYLNTIDYFQVEGVDFYKLPGEKESANDYGTYKGSMSNHDKVFSDIVGLFNGKKTKNRLVSGEEGIEGVRFMELALNSAKSGKVIYF